jgi:hypothetical protein
MSCKGKPTTADLHRAIAAAHLALAEHLESETDDDVPVVAPSAPPKVKRRRGPRLPRGLVPLTAEERERLARAGGILGQ